MNKKILGLGIFGTLSLAGVATGLGVGISSIAKINKKFADNKIEYLNKAFKGDLANPTGQVYSWTSTQGIDDINKNLAYLTGTKIAIAAAPADAKILPLFLNGTFSDKKDDSSMPKDFNAKVKAILEAPAATGTTLRTDLEFTKDNFKLVEKDDHFIISNDGGTPAATLVKFTLDSEDYEIEKVEVGTEKFDLSDLPELSKQMVEQFWYPTKLFIKTWIDIRFHHSDDNKKITS